MNWRKFKGMGSLGALGFLMLFQYQNCAPSMQTIDMSSKVTSEESSPVSTIDDVNATTAVKFMNEKIEVMSNEAPTIVQGACDVKQEGAILGWRVHDAEDNELQRGYSVCEQGQFEVEMLPASELECEKAYHVTAKLGLGSPGHMELERRCNHASL